MKSRDPPSPSLRHLLFGIVGKSKLAKKVGGFSLHKMSDLIYRRLKYVSEIFYIISCFEKNTHFYKIRHNCGNYWRHYFPILLKRTQAKGEVVFAISFEQVFYSPLPCGFFPWACNLSSDPRGQIVQGDEQTPRSSSFCPTFASCSCSSQTFCQQCPFLLMPS